MRSSEVKIQVQKGKKEGGAFIKPEKVENFQSCGQSNEVKIQLHEAFRKGRKIEPGCLKCLKLGLKFQHPEFK